MRPILFPESHVMLPPRLCGEIADYVKAWACGSSSMDWTGRFDKRDKDTHRFTIADTRGKLQLTVPIAKPASSRIRWDEVEISEHGGWWDVHRVALESAYGRTPYFEFYIDRFLPMLTPGVTGRFPKLHALASAWNSEIRDILGLASEGADGNPLSRPCREIAMRPYRQVRGDKLGFIAGLSILDLVFNLGPEAQLYLNDMAEEIFTG